MQAIQNLPKSIKHQILLKTIAKIEIIHSNNSRNFIATHIFIKDFLPSLKFYNYDNFKFQRTIDPSLRSPSIKLYNSKDEVLEEFAPGKIKYEELIQRIMKHEGGFSFDSQETGLEIENKNEKTS